MPLRFTFTIVALAGAAVAAQSGSAPQRSIDPNLFEQAYQSLAHNLAARAPLSAAEGLCARIHPDAIDIDTEMGTRPRISFTQSACYANVAEAAHNLDLCKHVRRPEVTPLRYRLFGTRLERLSPEHCRERVAQPRQWGGSYGVSLVLQTMGYKREEVAKAVRKRPQISMLFEEYESYIMYADWSPNDSETSTFLARLERLPDFSRGDDAAARQLDALNPNWKSEPNRDALARLWQCAFKRREHAAECDALLDPIRFRY